MSPRRAHPGVDREGATAAARDSWGPDRLVLTDADAVVGARVVRRVVITSILTEAQLGGPFTCDGLDAIAAAHRAAPG